MSLAKEEGGGEGGCSFRSDCGSSKLYIKTNRYITYIYLMYGSHIRMDYTLAGLLPPDLPGACVRDCLPTQSTLCSRRVSTARAA